MSIILTPGVSIPETRDYFALEQSFLCSKKTSIDSQECFFPLFNCNMPMPQFIDLVDPLDKHKNDFYSDIDQVQTAQTITLELEDVNTGVLTAVTAVNIGTFKDLGDYSNRPKVWSIVIDWNKVHALLGFGEYRLLATTKSAVGTTVSVKPSPCFALMPFDCEEAHGTVKIESLQTGHIHNGFDYRGITFESTTGILATQIFGWVRQMRWYGSFVPDIPDEEEDWSQNSNRVEKQIQQKITDKFKLQLKFIRSEFGVLLTKDSFLSDSVLISDYNLANYEAYRDREVRKISTDELNKIPMQKNINMSWTFKEVDEGTMKRIHG